MKKGLIYILYGGLIILLGLCLLNLNKSSLATTYLLSPATSTIMMFTPTTTTTTIQLPTITTIPTTTTTIVKDTEPVMTLYPQSVKDEILSEVNEQRVLNDLSPLKIDSTLNQIASYRANDMATNDYFSHTDWTLFSKFYYPYRYAGENLAVDFQNYRDIVDTWMGSPTHRDNILSENFTETGLGFAEGIYNGKDNVFVVQIFAKPLFWFND